MEKENIQYIIALCVVVILMVIYFNDEYRTTVTNYFNPKQTTINDTVTEKEHLSAKQELDNIKMVEASPDEKLDSLGYVDGASWTDVIAASDLDESVYVGQREYVKDVSRFSSGANFTSVADDNTNAAFVNFQGIRRPQNVPIGSTARQQPDVDQTVLMRNDDLRFTGCGVSFK